MKWGISMESDYTPASGSQLSHLATVGKDNLILLPTQPFSSNLQWCISLLPPTRKKNFLYGLRRKALTLYTVSAQRARIHNVCPPFNDPAKSLRTDLARDSMA